MVHGTRGNRLAASAVFRRVVNSRMVFLYKVWTEASLDETLRR